MPEAIMVGVHCFSVLLGACKTSYEATMSKKRFVFVDYLPPITLERPMTDAELL